MDDYMFKTLVERCRVVSETTSYLEIFTYSDESYDMIEEHPLDDNEFDNFLHRRGAFAPKNVPEGVVLKGGIRLVLQQNAQHPDTFTPHYISMKHAQYQSMIETLKLPYRVIESISCVGPFFWAAFDQDEEDPHLQIVYRKSDVRKKGKTRGWELSLSHSIRTGITTGFYKGTPSANLPSILTHLRACASQITHPLLLPVIIISHDMDSSTDIKQRDARDWLRRLEHAVSMRTEIAEHESYVAENGNVDLDAVNRDLVECHSQVLWKRPVAYMQILDGMREAMDLWEGKMGEVGGKGLEGEVGRLSKSMASRLEFYRRKLQGIDSYAYTTLQRLDIQRSALYNIIAQKESKLNFQMAGEQRKLAHAAKRDSAAMKTLSLLGAVFLPGAYLASVFSMTFFNFQTDDLQEGQYVAPSFWIYWAVTLPTTLLIVGVWWWYERVKEKTYDEEDQRLDRGVEEMEVDIMKQMRKRTLSKVSTWQKEKA